MATNDIYATLKGVADTWGEAIAGAKTPTDAVDYAFRYLLMLDSMNRTMGEVEQLARAVITEHAGEEGTLKTQYGTAVYTQAYDRVRWDTERLNQLLTHPVFGRVLAGAKTTTPVAASTRIKLGVTNGRLESEVKA